LKLLYGKREESGQKTSNPTYKELKHLFNMPTRKNAISLPILPIRN